MCVATPGKIVWLGDPDDISRPGRIRTADAETVVDFVMLPQARVGDHVIAHSGYAIRLLSTDEAAVTLRLLGDETPF